MKNAKMLTILVLGLGLMVLPASIVYGAQSLTVNGYKVSSITLELGQSRTVEVVSNDGASYVDYVGFDNGAVLGTFSHLETKLEAGDLAAVVEYDQPAFYGYYVNATGINPAPSAGVHFVFEYVAQELGETDLKLYQGNPPPSAGPLLDSVHITVIRPKMGTAFSYQGRLMDDNYPADGLYDFEFKLYDYKSDGSQLGSTIDMNDLDVIDGQFVVDLDFGSGIFDGNAVWLETTVAQSDGNDPCTLKPRVELTPTPYALHSASVAFPLELAGSSDDPIISATNSGAGKGIYAKAVGIYSTAVHGIGTHEYGRGVWGDATGTYGIGVRGGATSDYGLGVYGLATGSDGHGTVGRAWGSSGRGVYGEASNKEDVENYGGYFVAEGKDGRGVYGEATSTGTPDNPAANYGGYFKAAGEDGRAVYGVASNSGSVTNYGGYFQAVGEQGRGVHGAATGIYGQGVTGIAWNSGDDAQNFGGYFKAEGRMGRGVHSEVTGTHSMAVYGKASYSGNASNCGGYFMAEGTWGLGVFSSAGGTFGRGVRAFATGSSGVGVEGSGQLADFCASGPGLDYGSGSSIRWKTNISPIDEPLEKLILLRGVYFNWDADHGGHHDVGMIAEEVGEVMPEIVMYEENGIDANGMDYSKLTPLLVEAVKELKVENDSLKVRVEALERTMLQLAKVKELEL